jgi:hypothetical protein
MKSLQPSAVFELDQTSDVKNVGKIIKNVGKIIKNVGKIKKRFFYIYMV